MSSYEANRANTKEIVPHDDVVEYSSKYIEPWNALLVGVSADVAIDDVVCLLGAFSFSGGVGMCLDNPNR